MNSYRDTVINPGNEVSKLGRRINEGSATNNKAVTVIHGDSSYRGLTGYIFSQAVLRDMQLTTFNKDGSPRQFEIFQTVENDGAGGKPQFFTFLGEPALFGNLGWEVITMCADDVARRGGLPFAMVNQVDFKQITQENFPHIQEFLLGYGRALKQAGLINLTGETAAMRYSISAFCDTGRPEQLVLTHSGACLGLIRPQLAFKQTDIRPGLAVVGFKEEGYRCNGGTKLMQILLQFWGQDITASMNNPHARAFARELTLPSISYARTLSRLAGWKEDGSAGKPLATIYGAAHITGGGVWDKLPEILPQGIGVNLHSMPDPPKVLLQAQRLSQNTGEPMSDHECYGTFHGGCGMLVVCEPSSVKTIIGETHRDGITANVVGETTESSDGEITIRSRFLMNEQLSSKNTE